MRKLKLEQLRNMVKITQAARGGASIQKNEEKNGRKKGQEKMG